LGKTKRKLSAYNLYMRKALKGKMTGKTKAQRKAIFKTAARGWNKGKPKSISRSSKPKSRASPEKRSNPKGGNRRMGKSTFNMNKIYGGVRKVALFAPAVARAMEPGQTPEWKIKAAIQDYTGWSFWSNDWKLERAATGWMPFIFATVITAVVPKISRFVKGLLG